MLYYIYTYTYKSEIIIKKNRKINILIILFVLLALPIVVMFLNNLNLLYRVKNMFNVDNFEKFATDFFNNVDFIKSFLGFSSFTEITIFAISILFLDKNLATYIRKNESIAYVDNNKKQHKFSYNKIGILKNDNNLILKMCRINC